ncbi:MAG: response regulator transcription factor [Pseudomonadota bacterium]
MTTTLSCTIAIVDDNHGVVRAMQRRLAISGVGVAGFDDGDAFLGAEPNRFVAAIIDLILPTRNGLSVLQEARQAGFAGPAWIASGVHDPDLEASAKRAGIEGWLVKPVLPVHLSHLIHRIRGEADARAEAKILAQMEAPVRADGLVTMPTAGERFETLTNREREVLILVCEGLPNKQVAHRLQISEKTVEVHRSQVMRKLNVQNFAQLLRLAITSGILPDQGDDWSLDTLVAENLRLKRLLAHQLRDEVQGSEV